MYTGIVETTARVAAAYPRDGGRELRVTCDRFRDLGPGDSVALAGVCCTVVASGDDWVVTTLSGETLSRTYSSR